MLVEVEIRRPKETEDVLGGQLRLDLVPGDLPFLGTEAGLDCCFYVYRISDGRPCLGPYLTAGEAFAYLRLWNKRSDVKKRYSLKI